MLILDACHYSEVTLDEDGGETGICKICKVEKQLYHFTDKQDCTVQLLCCKGCQQRSNREEEEFLRAEMEENEAYNASFEE